MAQISPTAPMHPHQYSRQNGAPLPPAQMQQQQVPPQPPQPQQPPPPSVKTVSQLLTAQNESVWLKLGSLSEAMGELDGAMQSYERALRFNQNSVPAMMAISCILRARDSFPAAVEYLKQIIRIEADNGDVHASLGHCYLMMDDLQQAYSSYQKALYFLRNLEEPKLWYGIGILYDRYGSLEHAEEAFSQVMRMEPNFEKANEIYFRLGIIYKQQQKFQQSLECFRYIVADPPRPLSEEDIWFQIGHVHEQQKDYDAAKSAYKRVLDRDPNHAKVLQQLGWLHHQQSTSFSSQEQAIEYLEKSVNSDQTDAQSWYLLGRCYMSQQKYPKAYEAYQQAVYRDGRNPTFWCSIGVLYYQINQYRDALDAYSRAIRLNPNISEVWYDLGTLYESCSNQTTDALDAYTRAADLDPQNTHIKARLALLKGQSTNGMPNPGNAPAPQDVHPQAYQPGALGGPATTLWGGGSGQAPQGPPPPALAGGATDWNRRLADIQAPSSQGQALNPYDQRDRLAHHTSSRTHSSPRTELTHAQYEGQRPAPPSHRGLSPSAKLPPNGASAYPPAANSNGLAHSAMSQHAHAAGAHHAMSGRDRGPPGYPGPQNAAASSGLHSISQMGAPAPPGPGHQGGTPYHGSESTREQRAPDHTPSSRSNSRADYRHQSLRDAAAVGGQHGPPPGVENTLLRERERTREREDRSSMAQAKRHREWEDDKFNSGSHKKQANDENRSKLGDANSRRSSPPDHVMSNNTSPKGTNSTEEAGRPHTQDVYHPSEAAHHVALPPMQYNKEESPKSEPISPKDAETSDTAMQIDSVQEAPEQVQQQEAASRPPTPPAQKTLEPAARKMEVDEDYNDSGDEEKKPAISKEQSPRSASASATEPADRSNGDEAAKAEGADDVAGAEVAEEAVPVATES